MVIETLPTYEVAAPGPAALPARSRLYPLAPIGVGTPLVESLTSYVTRLAHAHGVTVEKLVATEVAPLVNKSARMTQDEFATRGQNVNGLGEWPPLAIAALERLTGRNDLAFLTLYPWRQVLSAQHLLRPRRAWCPTCYREWRQADQTLYHPLLWTLKLVQCCPQHQQPLWDCCPYPDCQKPLRLINSKVKLGYCPACQRWLGLEPISAQDRGGSSRVEPWQLWLADQLGRVLAAAPTLPTWPEQSLVALNLKSCLKAAEPGSVQGLARQIGMSPSPLFGWLNRGHHPQLALLARVCYQLGLSLLDLLTPQPERDYDRLQREASAQKQAEPGVETSALRRRLERLLNDPHRMPGSAAQVARQLGVTPESLKHHCPTHYQQIIQRNEQDQRTKRQLRNEKLACDLQAILDSEENPPPSMSDVGRRLGINPRTARANCPELCRAISIHWKKFHETRQAQVETRLQALVAAHEEPPPSISQAAIRLDENINYLYRKFPLLCRAVTQRYQQYHPPPTDNRAPKPANPITKSKNHAHLRSQFIALIAAETTPPPSLAEVSRQLACSIATLQQKHPELCRQLRQQWDTYRQRQRARLEGELRQMLAVTGSPPPPVREVAGRLGVDMRCLKRLLPDLYAEVVRRHQAPRQEERQRRQAFLDQVISENPVPFPSLSQVADRLGCSLSVLQRHFPEQSQIIVTRYQAYRQQERAVAQAALEAALTDEQQPPQLPLHVARRLGYATHAYVLTYFPDLCHQLFQRYEAHRRQVAQARLEAILAEPSSAPPPALATISRQLGYNKASLKYLCPELCQAIEGRHQTYKDEQKRQLKQSLEAVLSGVRTPPVAVRTVARELGFSPGMVRRYFPDLVTAVSAKYKVYARERGEQRRRRLDEAVKHMTRELYQAGIDPTLRQISLRLPNPKLIITPHLRQAWREARQALGLPT